jgi:hypothetical protein
MFFAFDSVSRHWGMSDARGTFRTFKSFREMLEAARKG